MMCDRFIRHHASMASNLLKTFLSEVGNIEPASPLRFIVFQDLNQSAYRVAAKFGMLLRQDSLKLGFSGFDRQI
ncbi:MAG: hypothetical protein PVH87_11885 [Desulfobacteraceae bacterium]|jgi:hypothetical protein